MLTMFLPLTSFQGGSRHSGWVTHQGSGMRRELGFCDRIIYFPTNAAAAAAAAKSLQSCPPLCDPIDGSPPGSPIPGIFQTRVLEWGAIVFSVPTNELLLIVVFFLG